MVIITKGKQSSALIKSTRKQSNANKRFQNSELFSLLPFWDLFEEL